jgi:hypothetical protein
MTPQQLKEFSGEHLYYEIRMLYGVLDIFKDQEKIKDRFIYNALIESFVIHTQIILDFFYVPQMKPDDAKAIHFVRDVTIWKEALPPYERYFRKFNRRRSREVVHLSYSRLEVKGEDKTWYPEKTTEHIKLIVDLFLEHADPDRLHAKMYELISV